MPAEATHTAAPTKPGGGHPSPWEGCRSHSFGVRGEYEPMAFSLRLILAKGQEGIPQGFLVGK